MVHKKIHDPVSILIPSSRRLEYPEWESTPLPSIVCSPLVTQVDYSLDFFYFVRPHREGVRDSVSRIPSPMMSWYFSEIT